MVIIYTVTVIILSSVQALSASISSRNQHWELHAILKFNVLVSKFILIIYINEPRHEKTCSSHMRTTKGEDQPAHPHSLISAFVVRCLDIITSFLAKSKISTLKLVSVVEKAGLSLTWSHTRGTGFLVIKLKYMYTIFFFLSVDTSPGHVWP